MSSGSSNAHHVTSGVAGTRLTEVDGADAQFDLGHCVSGTDDTKWVYVQASGAITAYDAVGIDENFQAASLTKAMADDGWWIGFAQFAFADNDYGFVAVGGSNIKTLLAASCAADVALYTTATAGVLDDASTSQTKIDGIVAVAGHSSATAIASEIIATFPKSTTF